MEDETGMTYFQTHLLLVFREGISHPSLRIHQPAVGVEFPNAASRALQPAFAEEGRVYEDTFLNNTLESMSRPQATSQICIHKYIDVNT